MLSWVCRPSRRTLPRILAGQYLMITTIDVPSQVGHLVYARASWVWPGGSMRVRLALAGLGDAKGSSIRRNMTVPQRAWYE